MARITRLTKRKFEHAVKCFQKGLSIRSTAALVHENPATISNWIRKGRKAISKYGEDLPQKEILFAAFARAYEHAYASYEMKALGFIMAGFNDGWHESEVTEREVLDKFGNVQTLKTTKESRTLDLKAALAGLKVVQRARQRDEAMDPEKQFRQHIQAVFDAALEEGDYRAAIMAAEHLRELNRKEESAAVAVVPDMLSPEYWEKVAGDQQMKSEEELLRIADGMTAKSKKDKDGAT